MSTSLCESIRDSLARHLLEVTISEQIGETCVITLPIPTVDGRVVGVFVEPRLQDFFVVNDGGKAVNELILQGVKVTESIKEYLSSLAQNFRISYTDEMFQCAGKRDELQRMILAVGACSGLAMAQLVGHIASPMEEPVREQFGRALRVWARKKFKVTSDAAVKGRHAQHKFDFVASPKSGFISPTSADENKGPGKRVPIMLSVLAPGSNPLASAQRFGFKTADLEGTPFGKWPKVAVEDRPELWSAEAKNIVSNCADVVIEIPTGTKIDARLLRDQLQSLVA